jgi:carbamoyl-phosphate synthase large subunit
MRKALVFGSGGIKIAEAAEFDYSTSQALKALKEEGIESTLMNPNIATVQLDLADKTYLLPLEKEFAEKVIDIEEPDGVLLGFGGQSALSLGVQLKDHLRLKGVKVLGTQIEGIEKALSRDLFRETMKDKALPIPLSLPAFSESEALMAANAIGFPVIVRVSFNLGGRGSFVAWSREDFEKAVGKAFVNSEVRSVLVERYLHHWKEIEFEVVRDKRGNSAAVACLENIDPMGIHTGDSVVIAPSQTLCDKEYQMLRSASLRVAEAIDLVGECNVQFALNGNDFCVIETNPRMSRSSALASKVTGYPLAYIATKLALGYTLDELINEITKKTTAFFEPAMDYVALKVPRWDNEKFEGADKTLGSEMCSTGELLVMGRSIGEVYEKAAIALSDDPIGFSRIETLKDSATDEGIDPFFFQKSEGTNGCIKQIDTLAGEFPASTNYLYTTKGSENDVGMDEEKKVLCIGAGPFRIGTSVEFDWAVMNFAKASKLYGYKMHVLNCNPETVSTDWDESDRLYFDVINEDRVCAIDSFERYDGVVAFAGGQTTNSIADKLEKRGIKLLGTCGKSVDIAENRKKFSELLERLGIEQPEWIEAVNIDELFSFASGVGYPVMVRPSYVLSGSGMSIARSEEELRLCIKRAKVSNDYPVVVSRFLNAAEAEIDCVSDGKSVYGVTIEHIEKAGIHSGDATMKIPADGIKEEKKERMREIALLLARELSIKGPFNIQFLLNNEVNVLELNLRASRSMPFSSRATDSNLMSLAAEAIYRGFQGNGYRELAPERCFVKSPQFSWSQLRGSYPCLGPEMHSTGEVAACGDCYYDALLKSWLSVKPNRLPKRILLYGDIPEEAGINFEKAGCEMIEAERADFDLLVTEGHRNDYRIRRGCADRNVPMILSSELALEMSRALLWLGDLNELSIEKSCIENAKLISFPSHSPKHDSFRKKGV